MKQNRYELLVPKPSKGKNGILFFMEWWAEAWREKGGTCKYERFAKPRIIFTSLGRLLNFRIGFGLGVKLIALGCHRIERVAWPWNMFHEIVPVMWDVWPDNREAFIRFIRNNRVKTVFCTSSQNVRYINERVPGVKVIWMPEGIKVEAYPMGPRLFDRKIDLLCYGRRKEDLVQKIDAYKWHSGFRFETGHRGLKFKGFTDLIAGIQDAKMTICYPQCDTCPEKAGDIETLTQRYWECMLCGTLIVGRAPKELIEVCGGRNPVIELDGSDPCRQIKEILDHLADYQEKIDENRALAEKFAPWSGRIEKIMDELGIGK